MKVSVQRAVGRTRIPWVPSPSSPVSLLFLLSYPALLSPPTLHPPALSLFFLLIFLAIETQNPCNPREPGLSRGDETRRVWRGGGEDAGKVNEEGKKHHILYVFQLNMKPAVLMSVEPGTALGLGWGRSDAALVLVTIHRWESSDPRIMSVLWSRLLKWLYKRLLPPSLLARPLSPVYRQAASMHWS